MSLTLTNKPNKICSYEMPPNHASILSPNRQTYFFGPCCKCGGNHVQDPISSDLLYNLIDNPQISQHYNKCSYGKMQQKPPIFQCLEFTCDQLPVDAMRCPVCEETYQEALNINQSTHPREFFQHHDDSKRNGLNDSDPNSTNWLNSEGLKRICCCNHLQNKEKVNWGTNTPIYCNRECCTTPNLDCRWDTQESSTNTQASNTNTQSTQSDSLLDYWVSTSQSHLNPINFNQKKDKAVMVCPVTKNREIIAQLPTGDNEIPKCCNKIKPKHNKYREKKCSQRICLFCNPSKVDKCF